MASRKPKVSAPATRDIALKSIYLRHSESFVADDFDPTMPGQNIIGEYKLVDGGKLELKEALSGDKPKQIKLHICRFTLNFQFTYLRKAANEVDPEHLAKIARVSAKYSVEYVFPGANAPEPEFLEELGKTTAVMHVWPYWREYCHASFMRMHFPPTLLPLLNVQAIPQKK